MIVVSLLAFELASKALPGVSLENLPGVEVDRGQEPIEIEAPPLPETSDTSDTSPGVEIQALVLPEESSITLDTPPGVETESVILSDRFLKTYTPPQPEIHYQIESDGQLSLLDFQVESVVEEAPDPDDFESLDVFHEAIALWDIEHPLDISLDSFTYWAPCSDDWFEPAGENEPLGVPFVPRDTRSDCPWCGSHHGLYVTTDYLERFIIRCLYCLYSRFTDSPNLDPVQEPERKNFPGVDRVQEPERKNFSGVDRVQALLKSSITLQFFIPVFWPDRPDEPPTAGVGARLPKPKPPSFSPAHSKRIPNAYQTHSCFVGATAACSGRSPPGGDVMA